MKVEQACRFRLDEGYCVFAKTPGLQPSQEEALGDIFNSTMNSLFPAVGSSILSCASSAQDVFLARNTLRTDVHGRKTMFTHTYVFPKAEYARLMQTEPMTVLGVEMHSMLESQSAGAELPVMELVPTAQAEPVEALFAKYGLDKIRYGRLLLGAYLAITHSTSLQLVTRLPLDQTPAMVRELTLCILEGLMPILKGKLSFSTGPDARMHISVISTAHTANPTGELLFGVEDDRYTNIRPRDELTELAMYSLAGQTHAQRMESVVKMQDWLAQTTNIQEGLSLTLICTAFCMTSGMEMDTEALLMLFRSIGNSGIATEIANKLLTYLVKRMREGTGCTTSALSLIAGRYLREDSSPQFREEADLAFAVAPVDVCIALEDAILKQDMNDRVRQLLATLMRRVPAEEEGISAELRIKLILWVLKENVTQFVQYATVLMQKCQSMEYVKLALGVLDSTREKPLTEVQDAVLAKALTYMAEKKLTMPETYGGILDSHSARYSEELMNSALEFFFQVRLGKAEAEAGMALVEREVEQYPQFAQLILQKLEEGANPAVWELYQTKICFPDDVDTNGIYKALKNQNIFNNPCGPMETRATECWLQLAQEVYAEHGEDTTEMSYYSFPMAENWYQCTEKLNLSQEMKQKIETGLAEIFWETVTLEQIYRNTRPIYEKVLVDPDTFKIKKTLAIACLQIRQDPKNCTDFIDAITAGETDQEMREALQECAQRMTFALLKESGFLSWDLVLCSCWKVTEKENGLDTKLFLSRCESLDAFFENHGTEPVIDVDASQLLADEKLRKTVYKLSGNSAVFQKLVEQIKPERSGLFGLFKSKKENKEADAEDMFDPTEPYEPEDRKKGKKKK